MQGVSVAFKAAAVAAVRKPKMTLECWFLESSNSGLGINVDGELDDTYFPRQQLINGVTGPDKKWALARDDCFPAADLYPIDVNHEGGWFGNVLSDGDGDLSEAVWVVTGGLLTTIPLQTFGWYGDSWLGYPVDFVIKYLDGVDVWHTLQTVVGNAASSYTYTHSTVVEAYIVRIEVTKISRANSHLYMAEFVVGLLADLSEYVGSFAITRERNAAEQGAPPLGNFGSSQLSLTLDNSDRRFSLRNSSGPYYEMLLPNRRMIVHLGFELPGGAVEYCDAGVFYTRKWSSDSQGRTTVIALDRSRAMAGVWYEAAVAENDIASDLITALAVAAGINVLDMTIAATTALIPHAVFGGASVLEYMTALAQSEGGCIYFSESGDLIFQALGGFAGGASVITLTDATVVSRVQDEVDDSIVYNVARVTGKRYKEGALTTIWSLQETLTLGSGTHWLRVQFSGPAVDVDNPVLVDADAGITITEVTYYSEGGLLKIVVVLGPKSIREMTIDGTPLEEDGAIVQEHENSYSVVAYGERVVPVTNDFIQSQAQAELLAEAIADGKADPGRYLPEVELRCGGLPHLQLGDKLTLQSTHLGISEDVYIVGMTLRWDNGLHGSLRLLSVTPVGPTDAPTPGQMAE